MDDMQFVSVPSRGILFPNYAPVTKVNTSQLDAGFRPLSGHLISKLNNDFC